MRELIKFILFICTIYAVICYAFISIEKNKMQYAQEHNCIWDYNDMCYTRDQKPWLFND